MKKHEAKQAIAELDRSTDLIRIAVQANPRLAISAFPVWCLGRVVGGLLRWLLKYNWPWEPG